MYFFNTKNYMITDEQMEKIMEVGKKIQDAIGEKEVAVHVTSNEDEVVISFNITIPVIQKEENEKEKDKLEFLKKFLDWMKKEGVKICYDLCGYGKTRWKPIGKETLSNINILEYFYKSHTWAMEVEQESEEGKENKKKILKKFINWIRERDGLEICRSRYAEDVSIGDEFMEDGRWLPIEEGVPTTRLLKNFLRHLNNK